MRDSDLEIPESNREIALHLQVINTRLTGLESTVRGMQETVEQRRFRLQDIFLSSLLLPLVGGILSFLLTKTLG